MNKCCSTSNRQKAVSLKIVKNTVDCHATEKAFNKLYTTQELISYQLLQGTGAVASMNNEERLTQINNLFCGLLDWSYKHVGTPQACVAIETKKGFY